MAISLTFLLDIKCYIFYVVALFILALLQLILLVYTQCLAIVEKTEIVCNINVAKLLGGCYHFSSCLLAGAKTNCCIWTDS